MPYPVRLRPGSTPSMRIAALPREEERLDPLHAQVDGELAVVVEHVRHLTRDNLALRHLHPPRRPDHPGGLVLRETGHPGKKRGSALPEGGENGRLLGVLVGGKGDDALPGGPADVFPEGHARVCHVHRDLAERPRLEPLRPELEPLVGHRLDVLVHGPPDQVERRLHHVTNAHRGSPHPTCSSTSSGMSKFAYTCWTSS